MASATPKISENTEMTTSLGSSQYISLKKDIESGQDANSTDDAKIPLLRRQSTYQRAKSMHDVLLRQETIGYENMLKCQFGWLEFFLLAGVLCVLCCFGSIFYGIYGGYELSSMWDKYTAEDINTWCNGKYEEEFTYREGSQTRDWGTYFDYMIQAGIIYGVLHVLVILYCCVYKPMKGVGFMYTFSSGVEYSWGIGLMFAAMWVVYFLKCLQLYDKVEEFCDQGTPVYEDTMDVFGWFYSIIILEFVKGGAMCLLFITVILVFCIKQCTCCRGK
eukprot:223698_1